MRFTYVLGTTGGNLSIKVFNIAGDFIIEIPPEKTVTQEGYNEVSWDGKNNAGKEIASGHICILFTILILTVKSINQW
jgi:flagellar hook assembly protein FlgD